MSDTSDDYTPTDEFVEYLARDTMRHLRYEQRFDAPTGSARKGSSFRVVTALGTTAGILLTLVTGMVLGASANYASAEVLPNGMTTLPARPTFAILPIKGALSAIGCAPVTRPVEAQAKTVAQGLALSAAKDSTPAAVVMKWPDRALVAAYVMEHEPTVVRGDTSSDYVVLVLDAAHRYVWSTHGAGGVAVDVGGDTRTPDERRAHQRLLMTESFDTPERFTFDSVARDTVPPRNRRTRRNASEPIGSLVARAGSDSTWQTFVLQYQSGFVAGRVRTDTSVRVYTSGWDRPRYRSRVNRAEGLRAHGSGESGIMGLRSSNVSLADGFVFKRGSLAPHALRVLVVHLTPGATWSGR